MLNICYTNFLCFKNTKSYQRKRRFEFLNAPEDHEDFNDDHEEELQIKRPTKSKKKKLDVEKVS